MSLTKRTYKPLKWSGRQVVAVATYEIVVSPSIAYALWPIRPNSFLESLRVGLTNIDDERDTSCRMVYDNLRAREPAEIDAGPDIEWSRDHLERAFAYLIDDEYGPSVIAAWHLPGHLSHVRNYLEKPSQHELSVIEHLRSRRGKFDVRHAIFREM